MTTIKPYLPWLFVLALTTGSGAAAGLLTNRWGTPADMAAAAERLARVPDEFGDWRLLVEAPLEPEVIEMLQCEGWRSRAYRNLQTGDTVHISILLGPPGPISVHTPEVCFTSQGHHLSGPAVPRSYAAPPAGEATAPSSSRARPAAKFWKTTFDPVVGEATTLIAYYSWCDGDSWQAPRHARLAFGGLPYLFKMQLATHVVRRPGHESTDPCDDFLKQFVPALDRAGFYESE